MPPDDTRRAREPNRSNPATQMCKWRANACTRPLRTVLSLFSEVFLETTGDATGCPRQSPLILVNLVTLRPNLLMRPRLRRADRRRRDTIARMFFGGHDVSHLRKRRSTLRTQSVTQFHQNGESLLRAGPQRNIGCGSAVTPGAGVIVHQIVLAHARKLFHANRLYEIGCSSR